MPPTQETDDTVGGGIDVLSKGTSLVPVCKWHEEYRLEECTVEFNVLSELLVDEPPVYDAVKA